MKKILLILLLFFVQCQSSPDSLKPLSEQSIILSFGDSLTSGVGATPGKSYPEQLAQLLGRTVMNEGVSGETTGQGLHRLPAALDRHKPHLLILCEGGNDFLRKVATDKTKDNLDKMIALAKDRGIDVVLIAVPQSEWNMKPHPLYKQLAQKWKIPLEEKTLSLIGKNQQLLSDPIHPNNAGYKKFAESIFTLLKKQGAIR